MIKATGESKKLENYTNGYRELLKAFLEIYDKNTDRSLAIRRIGVSFANVLKRKMCN